MFAVRNLSVIAYANSFTLWHYKGDDADIATITAPGFFVPAVDMLARGDMILVTARDAGKVLFVAEVNPLTVVGLA